MLTEFPNKLYRIYFPLRFDKITPELSKLLRIANLEKFLEKEWYRSEVEDVRN